LVVSREKKARTKKNDNQPTGNTRETVKNRNNSQEENEMDGLMKVDRIVFTNMNHNLKKTMLLHTTTKERERY